MYTAHIFFCLMLGTVPECGVADDTKGPYEDQQKCVVRLNEMKITMEATVPWMKVVAGRCVDGKGEFT